MARTVVTPVVPTLAGVAANPVAVDASASPNGMAIASVTPRTVVRVITTGTLTAVTVKSALTVGGLALADQGAVNTPATGTTWFGPFQSHQIQADGSVYMNFSSATGATIEAITPGT